VRAGVALRLPLPCAAYMIRASPVVASAAPSAVPAARAARPRLILASASPRRRELLAQLYSDFAVVPADVEEHEDPATDPRVMVAHNAALKAAWVAARHPDALVLGADTTVFIGDRVLNKPADAAEARAMLRELSGRTHTVFTGLVLRGPSVDLTGEVTSEVTFRRLDEALIEAYFAKVHTLDKAGGYSIQDHGEMVVAAHTGSLSNIIGLPLDETKQLLVRAGLLGLEQNACASPADRSPPSTPS